MDESWLDEDHLTAPEVARYLDGMSLGAERDRVEAHLADCPDCRRDVTSARALLGQRSRWPRRVSGVVATLLAASIVLVVGARLRSDRDGSSRSAVRAAADEASLLRVHAPTGPVRAGSPRFIWEGVPGALSYQFTLSRGDGTEIWVRGGADTAFTLPDSVVLEPGAKYLWSTDALLSDGSTRSTGVREVDIMR